MLERIASARGATQPVVHPSQPRYTASVADLRYAETARSFLHLLESVRQLGDNNGLWVV